MSIDVRPRAIIVFDGDCALCSGWVRFLLRHDREARYRFAAMQTPSGGTLLVAHGLDPDDPSSFLLLEGDCAWTDTDAIRRVVTGLGGVWRVAHVLAWIPKPLRDRIYRLVARNRYRWFGRNAQCFVPPPEQRARFL
jgi:predicted DCC family thiol-disulfide oxidoreductase YuxK